MKKALILPAAFLMASLALAGACERDEGAAAPEAPETETPAGEADPAVQPESLLPDPHETDVADLPRTLTVDDDVLKADVRFDEAVFGFAPAIAMDIVEDARIRLDAMHEDAATYKEADPEYFRPYGLKIDWIVSGASGRLAGLEGFVFTYTGGAHGNYMTDGRIYDTLTGDQLRFTDLLTDPAATSAALTLPIDESIAAAKAKRNGDFGSYEQFLGETKDALSGLDPLTGEISLVKSTEAGKLGGFVVHFAPYEIGSYAEGAYHIAIPQEKFRDYLKPEYAGLFAGEPAEIARTGD